MLATDYFTELTAEALEKIRLLLKRGETIAFPTETVYGLGALLFSLEGMEALYQLKKRDKNKALTAHLGSVADVLKVAEKIPDDFYRLAEHFLPGPLTIILKKKTDLPAWISPYPTIGIRIPSHPLFLQLAQFLKEPLAGTSANLSTQPPLVDPQDVMSEFKGQIGALVDGGSASLKQPSTVISLAEDKVMLLREGSLKKEEIEAVLKKPILRLS